MNKTFKFYWKKVNEIYAEYFCFIPLYKYHTELLIGLDNLLNMPSTLISENVRRDLKNELTGQASKFFIVEIKNKEVLPRPFKRLMYTNGMTKTEPSNIIKLSLENFSFMAYGIQMLYTDKISFYIIVRKEDLYQFKELYRETIRKFNWNYEGDLQILEELADQCEAEEIKHSYDYDKIFNCLDEYYRKQLFIAMKKAGLDKNARNLLRKINNTHITSFDIMLENKEARLKTLRELIKEYEEEEKPTANPLTYFEWVEEAEELEKEIPTLKEEDNSWNNFSTTLEDYDW